MTKDRTQRQKLETEQWNKLVHQRNEEARLGLHLSQIDFHMRRILTRLQEGPVTEVKAEDDYYDMEHRIENYWMTLDNLEERSARLREIAAALSGEAEL